MACRSRANSSVTTLTAPSAPQNQRPSMQTRTAYFYAALSALVLTMGVAAWLLASITELHDRFARHSRGLGLGFLILLIVLLAVATLWAGRMALRSRSPERGRIEAPADMIRAAAVQTEQAEGVIRQVGDESARARLNRRARPVAGGPGAARVSRRRLRHRFGRQDVADQRAPGTDVGKTEP